MDTTATTTPQLDPGLYVARARLSATRRTIRESLATMRECWKWHKSSTTPPKKTIDLAADVYEMLGRTLQMAELLDRHLDRLERQQEEQR